jgi:hypothetical protein
MRFSNVKTWYFRRHFESARADSAKIREATSPYSTVRGTLYYLWSDGFDHAGYGIRPDGELVNVFATTRGLGDAIVTDAIAHGATHLDVFEGHCSDLYARYGFTETRREPNWNDGGPDVLWMSR